MHFSNLFAPLLKESPSDATIASHKLMLRTGMIRQLVSGIYIWLPLGLKVLRKVENIVRNRLNEVGAEEILMPCIQPTSLWHQSGRIGGDDDLSTEALIMEDRKGVKLLFTPTAEEVIAQLFDQNVKTYKQLPMNLYQIQWKFRDEIRPRFGVMRGREFLMKDAYSFHLDKDCAIKTYNTMMQAYLDIFKDLGLDAVPVTADSGAIGGDMSHEFHILANTGESSVYYEAALEDYLSDGKVSLDGMKRFYAMEEEKHDPNSKEIQGKEILQKRGIEVGHIFYLGDKYSKAMGASVQNKEGKKVTPLMGCYGIGVSRIVGAIIEACHDADGIKWPKSVAPYDVLIVNLKPGSEDCDQLSAEIERMMHDVDREVLVDDTDQSPGAKLASADLIGIPLQIIIGPRGLKNGEIEIKHRTTGEKRMLSVNDVGTVVNF